MDSFGLVDNMEAEKNSSSRKYNDSSGRQQFSRIDIDLDFKELGYWGF